MLTPMTNTPWQAVFLNHSHEYQLHKYDAVIARHSVNQIKEIWSNRVKSHLTIMIDCYKEVIRHWPGLQSL